MCGASEPVQCRPEDLYRAFVDLASGRISGPGIAETVRTISDLRNVFREEQRRSGMNQHQMVYYVRSFKPVPEGTQGGLFWGWTQINPGLVGDEYFMTKGHLHAKAECGEYYLTVAGEGALILMDANRRTWWKPMKAGTLDYVPGGVAHRVANISNGPLTLLACWPSDAGHDYQSIERCHFGARLRLVSGAPRLVPE